MHRLWKERRAKWIAAAGLIVLAGAAIWLGARADRPSEPVFSAAERARIDAMVAAALAEPPRIFALIAPDRRLPAALAGDMPTAERKQAFIDALLPAVRHANVVVAAERARLKALLKDIDDGRGPSAEDRRWLDDLARSYGLASFDEDAAGELLLRVDIVPPSLALAQAAIESGWGTSRFARTGNALYGERTWRADTGMVPAERPAGETFEVRAFESVLDSVASYMKALNTHPAHAAFRERRAALGRETGRPSGAALASTLASYSERGPDYTATIEEVIRLNNLGDFDGARLAGE